MNGNQDMAVPPDLSQPMETCMTDNMPVALAPHYGVKGTLNVHIDVPAGCMADACLLSTDAQAPILLLAQMIQNGQSVMVGVQACHIEIPPVALKGQPMPVTLTVSDALAQSVPRVTSMGTLSGANTCAGFTSTPIPILIGTRLMNAATDPLPTFMSTAMPPVTYCGGMATVTCSAATDTACICDQEGDMEPGATVGAMNLPALDDVDQVYLALRTVVALDGMVFPPSSGQPNPGQRLKGQVSGLKLDQSPVGCHETPTGGGAPHDCAANTVASVAALNPLVTQSTNSPSTFVAMPVPGGYACSDLIANAATLFKGQ
jgi:hypothetical protein